MYKVMINPDGFPKVVSSNSATYAEMLLVGTYVEHCSGTKLQCDTEADNLRRELAELD